jgi:hypothetical protein
LNRTEADRHAFNAQPRYGEPEGPVKLVIYVNSFMARPKRFELLTPRFVVWCSIQLSYGRAPGIARGSGLRWQGRNRGRTAGRPAVGFPERGLRVLFAHDPYSLGPFQIWSDPEGFSGSAANCAFGKSDAATNSNQQCTGRVIQRAFPKAFAYCSGLKPTRSLPPTSNTGRLIMDGCAAISAIAFFSLKPS